MQTKEAIQGSWNEFAGAIQKKYSQITGDDLSAAKGNVQQLVGVIQRKTGQAREEIDAYLKTISSKSADAVGNASKVANECMDKASEGIRDGYEYAVDATQESYRSAKESVRTRPAEAVAIAFGVGIAMGVLGTLSMCRRN
ncbi:MAG: CsbD family protein [Pirellula staleyi]